jgi:hypothetical protein
MDPRRVIGGDRFFCAGGQAIRHLGAWALRLWGDEGQVDGWGARVGLAGGGLATCPTCR